VYLSRFTDWAVHGGKWVNYSYTLTMRIPSAILRLGLLSLFCALPLMACINDSQTKSGENQFVSSYGNESSDKAATHSSLNIMGIILIALPGLGVLAFAVILWRQEQRLGKK
jgi:hypothetical protein